MGSYTDNLGLYKVNTETDGNDTFNIETMLNDNWEKIDKKLEKLPNYVTTTAMNDAIKTAIGNAIAASY